MPHGLLSAHSAKICFICAHFFWPNLRCKVIEPMAKKSFPGRVPGPKKRTKMVPKSGPFQKEFFCSAAKKSPKNWTGPWLSLKHGKRKQVQQVANTSAMPNVRFKVRTQRRPAQFSRAATASQKDDRIETCTVGHHLFETMCPTAFLAPTLLRFVSSALSHKVGFFWPNLRCKVIEKVVPWSCSRPKKKEPKWFQNLGRFKKNSSAQRPKKVPKIGPAPGLA